MRGYPEAASAPLLLSPDRPVARLSASAVFSGYLEEHSEL
jgi:hypothetical protein